MAFPTTVELSDANVKSVHSTKLYDLGMRGITSDGRVFRYALAGMDISRAIPLVQAIPGGLANGTMNISTDTSAGSHVPTSTFRQLTFGTTGGVADSDAVGDEFADGYLVVRTAAQGGQILQIESNDTIGTDTCSFTFRLKTDSRLSTAAAVSDTAVVFAFRSPYWDVCEEKTDTAFKGATATSTGAYAKPIQPPAGVAVEDVADGQYFWMQTWGPCVCKASGAWVIGMTLFQTTVTATSGGVTGDAEQGLGELATATEPDYPILANGLMPSWGYPLASDPATTMYGLMFLTLAP